MDEATREAVGRWLELANEDLKMAKVALREVGLTRPACFHAQQCAEKSLKAFLASEQDDNERTHDLVRLVDRCTRHDSSFKQLREHADSLAMYAITPRYPDDWREISLDEAQDAVEKAGKVMSFIKKKLGE